MHKWLVPIFQKIVKLLNLELHFVIWKLRAQFLKFMFSKKASKIDKNLHRQFDDMYYVVNVKSMVKILSILVAFLENMNCNTPFWIK